MEIILSLITEGHQRSYFLKKEKDEYFYYSDRRQNAQDIYLIVELLEDFWWKKEINIEFNGSYYKTKLFPKWSLIDLINKANNLKVKNL